MTGAVGASAAAGGISLETSAIPAPDDSVFRIEQVAEGVWAAIVRPDAPAHAFANSLVVAGDSSVLIVDTQQSPAAARALVERLPALTDRPVRWIVNTHRHADHHRGNVAWREAHPGAVAVSLSETRRWIRREGEAVLARDRRRVRRRLEEVRAALSDPSSAPGGPDRERLRRRARLLEKYWAVLSDLEPVPPAVAFRDELEIDLGERTVRLLDLGAAHSEADLVAYVPDAGVVAAGDLVEGGLPYVADANPAGWLEALRRLDGLAARVWVPGHGPVRRGGALLAGHLNVFEAVERWLGDPTSEESGSAAVAACRAAWGVRANACRSWIRALGDRAADHGRDPGRTDRSAGRDGTCLAGHRAGTDDPFLEVWRCVRDHFYDSRLAGLDWARVREELAPLAAAAGSDSGVARVINQMLSRLDASHTRYFTRHDPEYYQLASIFRHALAGAELQRRFGGSGVRYPTAGLVTGRDTAGRTVVREVLDGSPTAEAGLRRGDLLLSVDGSDYAPVGSWAKKVGQPVTVRYRRGEDPGDVRAVTVVPRCRDPERAYVEALESSVRTLERAGETVLYVRAWSLAGEANEEALRRVLGGETASEADALILDLRGGWGGASPELMHLFDRRVPRLELQGRTGTRVHDPIWRKPVALLVDGSTRSGKEVLADAFRRHGVGPVVGEATAGAVLGGRLFPIPGGGLLYLAVTDVRVGGRRLEGRGVEPDLPVQGDGAGGMDPQLEAAVRCLAEESTCGARSPSRPAREGRRQRCHIERPRSSHRCNSDLDSAVPTS